MSETASSEKLPVMEKLAFDAAWERMVSGPAVHEFAAEVLWRLTVLQAKFTAWENERRVEDARGWRRTPMFLLLLVLLPVLAAGCAGWSRADYGRQAAYTAVWAVDTAQTLKIARSDGRYYEANPVAAAVIGRHPSSDAVLAGGAALYVGTTAFFAVLPPEYRKWAQYVAITAHGGAVVNNLAVGIGWGF